MKYDILAAYDYINLSKLCNRELHHKYIDTDHSALLFGLRGYQPNISKLLMSLKAYMEI